MTMNKVRGLTKSLHTVFLFAVMGAAAGQTPSVEPPAVVVCASQTHTFKLQNAPAGDVKWSVSPSSTGGTITATGNPVTYTAPDTAIPNVTVTATDAGGVTHDANVALYQSPCLNDVNEKFQLVGGVEESGFSSLGANTNAFLQAFTESPAGLNTFAGIWGRIRLLGAPQQATNGIVSTFTDPTGSLQKQDFSKVGQAIDFVAGFKIANLHWLGIKNTGAYSVNPVFGAGFTTPLDSQDVVLRYLMPDAGTIECQTLQSPDRFGKDFTRLKVTPGSTSCLIGPDGKTAVTQLAFSNQDRSNFFGKWGVGLRTTTRFRTADDDPQRGIVDFVVGQDASVTGGMMRTFVLKLDGVHPLPFGGEGGKQFLYLFGSASIRLTRNKNLDPLILKTVDPTVASPAIPSPEVVVLPLRQADRDFYRIGIALDLKQIFTKLAGQ